MYQRLQQKLQKIQISIQNKLTVLAVELSTKEDGTLSASADRCEVALRSQEMLLSSQELVQSLVEARQIWNQDQPQSPSHTRSQSLCTEIHKQLRLAEMDVQFWAAARQSSTILRRGEQLRDRLSTLIDYCDTGIKLNQQNGKETDVDVLP